MIIEVTDATKDASTLVGRCTNPECKKLFGTSSPSDLSLKLSAPCPSCAQPLSFVHVNRVATHLVT